VPSIKSTVPASNHYFLILRALVLVVAVVKHTKLKNLTRRNLSSDSARQHGWHEETATVLYEYLCVKQVQVETYNNASVSKQVQRTTGTVYNIYLYVQLYRKSKQPWFAAHSDAVRVVIFFAFHPRCRDCKTNYCISITRLSRQCQLN
jgi:hypothetical protein